MSNGGDKGKHSAVYPAGAGISVQAAALAGPAKAGAWTVPPGGLRFIQLALPNEDRARKGHEFMSTVSASVVRFVLVDSLGPAAWVRLTDGTVIAVAQQINVLSAKK